MWSSYLRVSADGARDHAVKCGSSLPDQFCPEPLTAHCGDLSTEARAEALLRAVLLALGLGGEAGLVTPFLGITL